MTKPLLSPDEFVAVTQRRVQLAARRAALPWIRDDGEAALHRLVEVAKHDSGGSRRVALFLLGLYNGDVYPFDLTELRGLDYALFDDCMAVLRMDHCPLKEVHRYFEDGDALFAKLAADWRPAKRESAVKR